MRRVLPLLLLVASCSDPPAPAAPDLSAPAYGPAGLFEDCLPAGQEPGCAAGLRCGLVRLGPAAPGFGEGTVAQCVPIAAAPLSEDQPCSYSERAQATAGAAEKRFDRCGVGAACVDTAQGARCRHLCALRVPKGCGAGRLCVLPSPVSSVGYCAAPDGCRAVPPQGGCKAGPDGQTLGCYVLAEARQAAGDPDPPAGTFCLPRVSLGDSSGDLGARCERSANCRPGLSCVAQDDHDDPTCRPYCALPSLDGGTPDLGGAVRCAGDLGTCHPIAYVDGVGRCF